MQQFPNRWRFQERFTVLRAEHQMQHNLCERLRHSYLRMLRPFRASSIFASVPRAAPWAGEFQAFGLWRESIGLPYPLDADRGLPVLLAARSPLHPRHIRRIVRGFFGDPDVVGMVLHHARAGHLAEARVGAQFINRAAAGVAHGALDAAHELVHELREMTAIRDQSFHAFGQSIFQTIRGDPQARARSRGIIKIGLDLGVFRIDPQPARDWFVRGFNPRIKFIKLRNGIEGDVIAVAAQLLKFFFTRGHIWFYTGFFFFPQILVALRANCWRWFPAGICLPGRTR